MPNMVHIPVGTKLTTGFLTAASIFTPKNLGPRYPCAVWVESSFLRESVVFIAKAIRLDTAAFFSDEASALKWLDEQTPIHAQGEGPYGSR